MKTSPYEKPVATGIARLTKHFGPGWRRRVKLSRLNQGSCVDCVLGQLFEEFGQGLSILYGRKILTIMSDQEFTYAVRRGFTVDAPWSELTTHFALLSREWQRQLRRLAREEI